MSFGLDNIIEFPRKKKYLHHLNVLLGSKIINPPQQLLSSKLFPARKLTSNQSMTKIKQYRSQTSQNSRKKQKQKFRCTVLSKLKERKDIRASTAQLKQSAMFRSKSVQLTKQPQLFNINYASVNLKKQSTNQVCQDSNNKELGQNNSIKKQFLRKGSSLNRQIVLNLLKLKLSKKSKQNSKDFENDDIIKMIKLYKGGNDNNYDSNFSFKNAYQLQMNREQKVPKDITGWQYGNNPQYNQYQQHEH